MIEFVKMMWSLLRAENGNGRRLRRPWVALVIAPVSLLFGTAALLCWIGGWICRRNCWAEGMRRFGNSAGDIPRGIFFSKPKEQAEGKIHAAH